MAESKTVNIMDDFSYYGTSTSWKKYPLWQTLILIVILTIATILALAYLFINWVIDKVKGVKQLETGDTKFYLSFESNGQRLFANKVSYNITDAIRQVRKEYPTACMFKVLNKVKVENRVNLD